MVVLGASLGSCGLLGVCTAESPCGCAFAEWFAARSRSCLASSRAWIWATASSGLICRVAGALAGAAPLLAMGLVAGRFGLPADAAFFTAGLFAIFVAAAGAALRVAAFFGAAFLAGAFLGAAFFGAAFLAAAFFGAVFFIAAFFGAAFFTAAFFGAAFFATVFFGAAFFAEAFFGAAFFMAGRFPAAFFAAGRAAVRFTGVLMPVFLLAALFLVAVPEAAFFAVDFFAADLRVVAMRHHSCGWSMQPCPRRHAPRTRRKDLRVQYCASVFRCHARSRHKARPIQDAGGLRSSSTCRSQQPNALRAGS